MIAGAVVERKNVDLTIGLQLTRFSPEAPEGVRMTQADGRYTLSEKWEVQWIDLYLRSVPGHCYPGRDQILVAFSEPLWQVTPGWLSTSVSLQFNNTHFPRRPVQFYVRRPCGLPSGQVLWDDPFAPGVSWLLTVETLRVAGDDPS